MSATRWVPRFVRVLIALWLALQALILAFILATHGAGMDPDLRLLSGAAMTLASFPLSIGAMFAALTALEAAASLGLLAKALLAWASCFLAGAIQLWLLTVIAGRIAPPAARD